MLDENIMNDIHEAAAKGKDTLAPEKPTCTWTEDCDCYDTDCGHHFMVNDGTPSDNGMAFCCFCGKELVEDLHKPEPDDEGDDE